MSRDCGGGSRRSGVLLVAWVVSFPLPATAATIDGAVNLSWTDTDLGNVRASASDHSANLALQQELSPYLRLRFRGLYGQQSAAYDGQQTLSRDVLQPAAELAYNRPNLSWRLAWENLRIDSSNRAQEFESNALLANLAWRARGGFRLGLSYREGTNQTENVAALGRELEERQGRLDAVLERRFWTLGYGASYNELTGGLSGLAVEQFRQDARLDAARSFAHDRLRLSFAGTAGRLEARERRGDGDLGEPLPAIQGLFALDASPAIGELGPVPGLVDGDTAGATSPPIEIGGANTLRNVGLDLGLPRPATRLEIVVDRASGPQVVWDVYESADNLIWEPVTVVSRGFDSDLLRYTLRFPETSLRYLKAVNVTSNPVTEVRVTELRALLDLGTGEVPAERSSDLYRAAANLGWKITSRARFDAGAEANNDSTTVGGVVRRDSAASGWRAGLEVDLTRDLRLSVRYRWSQADEGYAGGLTRISDDAGASLRWAPLPTVEALLSAGMRTDSDERSELSNTEFARGVLSLDLLDELRLVTDFGASRLEGAGISSPRDTLTWTQRIEMRPRAQWRVNGGWSWVRTDAAVDGGTLFESRSYSVDFGWTPGSALTLTGTLSYFDESTGSTLRQGYGLFWTPGPKLSVSVGWDQFEQRDGLLTGNDSISVHYQAGPRMVIYAALSRSRSVFSGGSSDEVNSAHAGTTVSF